jgi:hypothetical protein
VFASRLGRAYHRACGGQFTALRSGGSAVSRPVEPIWSWRRWAANRTAHCGRASNLGLPRLALRKAGNRMFSFGP